MSSRSIIADSNFACKSFSLCGAGYGSFSEGSVHGDRQCAICQPGFYSNAESPNRCESHRRAIVLVAWQNCSHRTLVVAGLHDADGNQLATK